MENVSLDSYAMTIGFMLPVVIAFFKDQKWSPAASRFVTMMITIGIAILYVFARNDFDPSQVEFPQLMSAAVQIFTMASTSYSHVWKLNGIEDNITKNTGVGRAKTKV